MKEIIEIKQQVLEDKNLKDFLEKNNIRFVEKTVETSVCPNCGKEFIMRGKGTKNEKKYCSFTCRSRFYARAYHKFKQEFSEEYRQKQKEYFENWRKENKEHFNNLVREPNRVRAKENYHKWDKEGLCVQCGKKRDNPNSKSCLKCRPLKLKNKKKNEHNL